MDENDSKEIFEINIIINSAIKQLEKEKEKFKIKTFDLKYFDL